jgi:hypothetical protein
MNVKLSSFLISIVVLFGLLGVSHEEQLSLDYYNSTCPQALDIVREVTWRHVAQNFSLAAPLLRLHFQDCFVRVIQVFLSLYNSCSYLLNFVFLYMISTHIYQLEVVVLQILQLKKKKNLSCNYFYKTHEINVLFFFFFFFLILQNIIGHICIIPLKFKMCNILHITFILNYIYVFCITKVCLMNYVLGL